MRNQHNQVASGFRYGLGAALAACLLLCPAPGCKTPGSSGRAAEGNLSPEQWWEEWLSENPRVEFPDLSGIRRESAMDTVYSLAIKNSKARDIELTSVRFDNPDLAEAIDRERVEARELRDAFTATYAALIQERRDAATQRVIEAERARAEEIARIEKEARERDRERRAQERDRNRDRRRRFKAERAELWEDLRSNLPWSLSDCKKALRLAADAELRDRVAGHRLKEGSSALTFRVKSWSETDSSEGLILLGQGEWHDRIVIAVYVIDPETGSMELSSLTY